MQIYSNPVKNILTFRSIPDNSTIEIFNINGNFVKRLVGCNNDINLDISSLKRGLYLVRTYNEEYFLSELLIKE